MVSASYVWRKITTGPERGGGFEKICLCTAILGRTGDMIAGRGSTPCPLCRTATGLTLAEGSRGQTLAGQGEVLGKVAQKPEVKEEIG